MSGLLEKKKEKYIPRMQGKNFNNREKDFPDLPCFSKKKNETNQKQNNDENINANKANKTIKTINFSDIVAKEIVVDNSKVEGFKLKKGWISMQIEKGTNKIIIKENAINQNINKNSFHDRVVQDLDICIQRWDRYRENYIENYGWDAYEKTYLFANSYSELESNYDSDDSDYGDIEDTDSWNNDYE
jgi:hypothetical protein